MWGTQGRQQSERRPTSLSRLCPPCPSCPLSLGKQQREKGRKEERGRRSPGAVQNHIREVWATELQRQELPEEAMLGSKTEGRGRFL